MRSVEQQQVVEVQEQQEIDRERGKSWLAQANGGGGTKERRLK